MCSQPMDITMTNSSPYRFTDSKTFTYDMAASWRPFFLPPSKTVSPPPPPSSARSSSAWCRRRHRSASRGRGVRRASAICGVWSPHRHNAKSARWSHRTDIIDKACIAQRGIVPPLIDQHPIHRLPVHLTCDEVAAVGRMVVHQPFQRRR